ncbi:MAG: YlcI/YnfO family protein [Enterobacterales bacterium endosymbiont of Blomia tropicalis]|uniref:YlcI/YnfO family protein n=1 Tax=Mixta mediterraneensis TaxID=2758443 RepID=UPI0025A7F287|nr:YlcI/YnfO family protein [Mixta mediterraneensis]MDL4915368.1 YlcI/YnfO family protein [Mixta mediterraneensis]
MATGTKNDKSQKLQSRAPHEVIDAMEKVKEPGESTGQFIVAALKREISYRQRKLARDTGKDSL